MEWIPWKRKSKRRIWEKLETSSVGLPWCLSNSLACCSQGLFLHFLLFNEKLWAIHWINSKKMEKKYSLPTINSVIRLHLLHPTLIAFLSNNLGNSNAGPTHTVYLPVEITITPNSYSLVRGQHTAYTQDYYT